MLLRHRPPKLHSQSITAKHGFEHLDPKWIAILRWLNANRVDYVLVGGVAEAIRGRTRAEGPVTIVPAPYGRNFDRLSRALSAENACLRLEHGPERDGDSEPAKLTGEKLAGGHRWMLRCGTYDLDIEGRRAGAEGSHELLPGYQELLYEAGRYELAAGVESEVASPEDIEHYAHVRRTGTAPQIRITRASAVSREGA